MGDIRRHALISGRVQGVGFRYWTRGEAERLGVRGWVRNRADGRVEAELEGDQVAVDELLESLRHGPPGAVVDGIDITDRPLGDDESFRIAPVDRGGMTGWFRRG